MKHLLIFLLAFLVISANLHAQDKTGAKVHGYVFGDYFYKIGGDDKQVTSSQFAKTPKDFQGFQFRRLYMYLDYNISEDFTSQFLLEGNDKAFVDGKHGVFVKTAYLQWKNLIPNGTLTFGLVPTPTWSWGAAEKAWNYRAIEKTVADFRGLGSASDIGIALKGNFDDGGNYGYTFMIGNGSGQRPETNKYKKYYGNLSAKPVSGLTLEAYGDFEPAADEKNKTTLKGFASYKVSDFNFGVEAVQQTQAKLGTNKADITPFGISFWGWVKLSSKINAFARYDMFNPDTKVTNKGYKESFITAGLDFMPIPNVHIMPNIWINSFSAKDASVAAKDADVVARVTFFYIYK